MIGPKIKLDISKTIEKIRNGITLTEIASQLGITRVTLANYLKQANISKSLVKFNHRFFQNINTEDKAYWLGFCMADGCVSTTHSPKVTIALAHKDRDHLEKWRQAINSSVKLVTNKKQTSSQHYSRQMCDDLITIGCTSRKSLTLKFPEIKTNLLHHFVRGYFDGDGSATRNKKKQLRLTFIGTSQFLDKLQEILQTNNKLQTAGNNKKARSLQINGNKKARKISDWMYKDATVYLERKREVCDSEL